MKVLIWIGCILAYAIIDSIFRLNGIRLGAIPAVILFSVDMWLARELCRKWDEHKEAKRCLTSDEYLYPNGYKCGNCGRKGPYAGDCPNCGSSLKFHIVYGETATQDEKKKCELCDEICESLTGIKIVDDLGTRFRNVCPKCYKKYNGSRSDSVTEIPEKEEKQVTKILYCRKCGEKLMKDSDFCGKCGTKILK